MSITTPVDTPTPVTTDGDGDHDRFTHIVKGEELVDSMVEGQPLMALCGKTWVPSRDPDRYPVCKMCIDVYEHYVGPWTGRR